MKFIATLLWLLVPVPLLCSGIAATLEDAVKVVDVAREKDVVWLSLATALGAIGFSGWLVWRQDKKSDAATSALLDASKSILALSVQIHELREEMRDKPCLAKK